MPARRGSAGRNRPPSETGMASGDTSAAAKTAPFRSSPSCRLARQRSRHPTGSDEREQAGLLAPRSTYSAGLPIRTGQWPFWRFVARYSGATARDSHPLPYSPHTRGTCSRVNPEETRILQRTRCKMRGFLRLSNLFRNGAEPRGNAWLSAENRTADAVHDLEQARLSFPVRRAFD